MTNNFVWNFFIHVLKANIKNQVLFILHVKAKHFLQDGFILEGDETVSFIFYFMLKVLHDLKRQKKITAKISLSNST